MVIAPHPINFAMAMCVSLGGRVVDMDPSLFLVQASYSFDTFTYLFVWVSLLPRATGP